MHHLSTWAHPSPCHSRLRHREEAPASSKASQSQFRLPLPPPHLHFPIHPRDSCHHPPLLSTSQATVRHDAGWLWEGTLCTRDWDLAHSLLLLASGVVGPNTEKLLTYHHFHLYRPPLLCCARRWIREPAPRSPSQHLCAGTGTALPSSPVGKVWGNGYSSLKVSASLLHLSPFSCSLLLNVQNRFYLVYIKTLEIKQLFFL